MDEAGCLVELIWFLGVILWECLSELIGWVNPWSGGGFGKRDVLRPRRQRPTPRALRRVRRQAWWPPSSPAEEAAHLAGLQPRIEAHVAVLKQQAALPGVPSATEAWARAYRVTDAARLRDGISDAEWRYSWPIMVEEMRQMQRAGEDITVP